MKQRLISVMLACLMALTVLPMTVGADDAAADENAVKIEFETVEVTAEEGKAGSTVEVKVYIVNNPGFVSTTIPVMWDTAELELISVPEETRNLETNGLLAEGSQPKGIDENSGWIGYEITEAVKELGLYHLAWNYDTMYTGNYEELNFTEDGLLCVMEFKLLNDLDADGKYTIAADLTDSFVNLMNWDMQDYTKSEENLNSTGITLTFGEGGIKMAEAAEEEHILGDVDGDGKITTSDASGILRYIVGYVDDNVDMAYGDVDNDDKITTSDASGILRYIVGYTDNPNIGKPIKN